MHEKYRDRANANEKEEVEIKMCEAKVVFDLQTKDS